MRKSVTTLAPRSAAALALVAGLVAMSACGERADEGRCGRDRRNFGEGSATVRAGGSRRERGKLRAADRSLELRRQDRQPLHDVHAGHDVHLRRQDG